MPSSTFLDRVFANLPTVGHRFVHRAWKQPGRPTQEGVGLLPGAVAVESLVGCILDVDHYKGKLDFVETCHHVDDPRFQPPCQVRFYQRIQLPVIGAVQHALVLTDHGDRDGWRVLGWHQLDDETAGLDPRNGARSAYNVGAWLIRADVVGYALSSAPRKEDVGRLKFAAMTRGADAGAARVVEGNIAAMKRWSAS